MDKDFKQFWEDNKESLLKGCSETHAKILYYNGFNAGYDKASQTALRKIVEHGKLKKD